jgi:hypothetical protein
MYYSVQPFWQLFISFCLPENVKPQALEIEAFTFYFSGLILGHNKKVEVKRGCTGNINGINFTGLYGCWDG